MIFLPMHFWPVPFGTQGVRWGCLRTHRLLYHPPLLPFAAPPQVPPLRALPVSPCVHKGCRRRPYPVTGSGRQDPQLPRRLAYPRPIQRADERLQGLGAPAPQPVGASGQLGKEQALPHAENLFSRCEVRLGVYDGPPHGGTCPSSAELPEFLQRQECGTTETVSEASPCALSELAGVTLAAPFPLTRGYERLFLSQFSSPDGEPW